MKLIKRKIRTWGDSVGVSFPKRLLEENGIPVNSEVNVTIEIFDKEKFKEEQVKKFMVDNRLTEILYQ